MIPFNIPPFVGNEIEYVQQAVNNHKICGDGPFTKKCHEWLEDKFGVKKALLTTSGTSALEMAAILCEVGPGDEVILPSYTFSTTATAFSNLGAKLVFVDIRPDTMNIDESKVEDAITEKTRVIVPVHYAGVSCEMDTILAIAEKHGLLVVEDAAQGVMSTYKGRPLGTMGNFGCISFHETKNYSMGEGGAIYINDMRFSERAEIIREKGTNRARFFRGQVDKYTWVDRGSSYLPSDMNAAYLYAQLEEADQINLNRIRAWTAYDEAFSELAAQGLLETPMVPKDCVHNAHMYYLKCASLEQRSELITYLAQREISACFHYVPLHSSPAGRAFGVFSGVDANTTSESDKLVRLPLYYGISDADVATVIGAVKAFYGSDR